MCPAFPTLSCPRCPTQVLITIASSFAIGAALEKTDVSLLIGSLLVRLEPSVGPLAFLGAIYLFASLLSCIVSNAAAVVVLYSVLRDVQVLCPLRDLHCDYAWCVV